MGHPMSMDRRFNMSDHGNEAPHVNGPISDRTDMGHPMSIDQKIMDVFSADMLDMQFTEMKTNQLTIL